MNPNRPSQPRPPDGKEVDDMAGTISMYKETGNSPEEAPDARPKAVSALPGRLGWIVALSLVTGLAAAFLFAFLPFVAVEEGAITGAVLCGFAMGWAALGLLSLRFTDQPQRWAVAPALFMVSAGSCW
jgi:hypothetical protein